MSPFEMTLWSPANNFYRFECEAIGQRLEKRGIQPAKVYYAGCLKRVSSIRAGSDGGKWPECAEEIRHGRCPALAMMADEAAGDMMGFFDSGEEVKHYYLDRDDSGPGIAKRAELGLPERTAEEVKAHHDALALLGMEPYKAPELTPAQRTALAQRDTFADLDTAPAKPASKRKKAAPDDDLFGDLGDAAASNSSMPALDLGAMISEAAQTIGAAA